MLGQRDFHVKYHAAADIFDSSQLYAYTGVDRIANRVVIAFHGDVSIPQLARRLWKGKPIKIKKLCKGCKTHKYYALVNSKICPEVIASTRTLIRDNPTAHVLITGHGFGGALAALCGYEMEMARVFTRNNKRQFISFGQPRVGNCHWARKFYQIFPTAIRVTNGNDPVVHIPPCHADPKTQRCIEIKDRKKRLWAFHNPTQVWYPNGMPSLNRNRTGNFKVCKGENWGEDPDCRSHPLGFSMADHHEYFRVPVATNCRALVNGHPHAVHEDGHSELSAAERRAAARANRGERPIKRHAGKHRGAGGSDPKPKPKRDGDDRDRVDERERERERDLDRRVRDLDRRDGDRRRRHGRGGGEEVEQAQPTPL